MPTPSVEPTRTDSREPVRVIEMGGADLVRPELVPEWALKFQRSFVLARQVEDFLHALHLYGAAGIAAFGWAVCRLLGVAGKPWVPLWFCAGLLVYNIDRLRGDAADGVNLPRRSEATGRLRRLSLVLAATAGGALFLIPILERDWWTLVLIFLGLPLVLNYSIPFRGRRLKDVPYLKTFFAPTLVLAAVFALPLVHEPMAFPILATPFVAIWGWGILLANMLLCDVRDIPGDRRTGVVSLPTEIGLPRTRRLVWALAGVTCGVATQLIFLGAKSTRGAWIALAVFGSLYVAGLGVAVIWPRSERFYERWVEGLLFLPALVVAFFL